MSRRQNTEQSHNMKAGNKSLKSLAKFKYIGTTVITENYIDEEIVCSLCDDAFSVTRTV
jgi:hypothetical protein